MLASMSQANSYPAVDFRSVMLSETRARIYHAQVQTAIALESITYSGGIARTPQSLEDNLVEGALVRMELEHEEVSIRLCVQILAMNAGSLIFRVYGLSGAPKTQWEALVKGLRDSNPRI